MPQCNTDKRIERAIHAGRARAVPREQLYRYCARWARALNRLPETTRTWTAERLVALVLASSDARAQG